jgi:hypothetical protein
VKIRFQTKWDKYTIKYQLYESKSKEVASSCCTK